jgi:hypothetical protein
MQDMGGLSSTSPGHLTNDEWDEIGQNDLKNPDGTYPNNATQLQAARDAKAKADADAAAKKAKPAAKAKGKSSSNDGGPKLLQGYATVMHGKDAKKIGYANTAAVHAAGGSMNQGSNTAFVGPEAFPISRVGDGTTDDKVAVSGADDFLVGGGTQTG